MGIVVFSDNAKYDLESSGEYTQGAGGGALLVRHNPRLVVIPDRWGVSTTPVHDFFKPRREVSIQSVIDHVLQLAAEAGATIRDGMAEAMIKHLPESTVRRLGIFAHGEENVKVHRDEPVFDGQFSNACYVDRMQEAFVHFQQNKKTDFLNEWSHIIFHLPYAFHGRRMIFNNWLNWIKNDITYKDLLAEIGQENDELFIKKAYKSNIYKNFITSKIAPGEKASSHIGNMYSASVFMSLLSMLNYHFDNDNEIKNQKVGFISYGSGSKAKIFQGEIEANWKERIKTSKLFESLNKRKEISFDEYQDLHKSKKISPLSNHSIRFSHTDDSTNSKGYRRYKI